MQIHLGEIYGKQSANKFVMYSVLKVSKNVVTLQNIDNPRSQLEVTTQKLGASGYIRVSQTPYVKLPDSKNGKTRLKPGRCPYTLDFLALRADTERPAPIMPDLFSS